MTTRRSPTSTGPPAGDRSEATGIGRRARRMSSAPHWSQYRAWAVVVAPHDGHGTSGLLGESPDGQSSGAANSAGTGPPGVRRWSAPAVRRSVPRGRSSVPRPSGRWRSARRRPDPARAGRPPGTPTSPPWRTVMSSGMPPRYSRPCSAAKRSPPPRPKISVSSPQCGQAKAVMFSTRPMTGTLIRLNIASALATSASDDRLGRRHQDRPGDRDGLGERQLRVGRARRQVDDEVVELAPVDVAQELLDRAADERAAPDDRLALGHEELDRDDLDAVALERA